MDQRTCEGENRMMKVRKCKAIREKIIAKLGGKMFGQDSSISDCSYL